MKAGGGAGESLSPLKQLVSPPRREIQRCSVWSVARSKSADTRPRQLEEDAQPATGREFLRGQLERLSVKNSASIEEGDQRHSCGSRKVQDVVPHIQVELEL